MYTIIMVWKNNYFKIIQDYFEHTVISSPQQVILAEIFFESADKFSLMGIYANFKWGRSGYPVLWEKNLAQVK